MSSQNPYREVLENISSLSRLEKFKRGSRNFITKRQGKKLHLKRILMTLPISLCVIYVFLLRHYFLFHFSEERGGSNVISEPWNREENERKSGETYMFNQTDNEIKVKRSFTFKVADKSNYEDENSKNPVSPVNTSVTFEPLNNRDKWHKRSIEKVKNARRELLQKYANETQPNLNKTVETDLHSNYINVSGGSCNQQDAFESIPINGWIPLESESTDKKEKWIKLLDSTMTKIKSSRLGGNAIREFVRDEALKLRSLRHALFCRKPGVRGGL